MKLFKAAARFARDVAAQLVKLPKILAQAVTDPKSEIAIVLGAVTSVAALVVEATSPSGKVDWKVLLPLLAGFITRARVTPAP